MRSCFCGSIWTDVADLFVSCPAMPGCAVLPRSPAPVVVEVLVADRPDSVVLAPLLLESVLLRSDRKSTRLNSSHANISYAVFCLKKKKKRECISSCKLKTKRGSD